MKNEPPLYDSFLLDTPFDGKIRVTIGIGYRYIRLCERSGQLYMTAPQGVTYSQIIDGFLKLRVKFPAVFNTPTYSIGSDIEFHEGKVLIRSTSMSMAERRELSSRGELLVLIPDGVDLSNPKVTSAISRTIMRVTRVKAAQILLPRAKEIAARLNLTVKEWMIGTGMRILGTCYPDKRISLSAAVLFLTPELRDYIICHELAHLTEMNHSERFHRLCDTYLEGHERRLIAALKSYQWPIIR